jgi:hypothetical protein
MKLSPPIERACAKAGFNVSMQGYQAKMGTIRFVCQRTRYHSHLSDDAREKKKLDMRATRQKPGPANRGIPTLPKVKSKGRNKKKKKHNPTNKTLISLADGDGCKVAKRKRPSKVEGEECCTFKFNIHWHQDTKRWFLPMEQMGRADHCEHIQLNEDQVRVRTKTAGSDALEEALDTMRSHIRTANVADCIEKRHGVRLDNCQHNLKFLNLLKSKIIFKSD